MIIKPDNAPPICAKCAIESDCKSKTPKITSIATIAGTKYLALMGYGINKKIMLSFGYKTAKAVITPYNAPLAPSIAG